MRRSGRFLSLAGILGAAFFVLTDPRLGPAGHSHKSGALDWRYWLFELRSSPANIIDAGHEAWLATAMGLAGSLAVLALGIWLSTRQIEHSDGST